MLPKGGMIDFSINYELEVFASIILYNNYFLKLSQFENNLFQLFKLEKMLQHIINKAIVFLIERLAQRANIARDSRYVVTIF